MTRAEGVIWVEKYRPQTLDEIMGNEPEVARLKDWVDDASMPNVLLWGPQGTGKTAAAFAFAQDKYGDNWRNHMLQLNASDERGIETVRTKIKDFASQGGVMGEHDFNIVLLDEVDNMTRDAQPAMRRIMEDFHDRTRFFLVCNYPNKLIDPIQSRTAPLQMSPLTLEQIIDLLEDIATQEGLDYSEAQLGTIATASKGDARKAIHTLQSATSDGELIDEFLEAVVTLVDSAEVEEFVDAAIGEDQEVAMAMVDDFVNEGIDAQALCGEILEVVLDRDDLPRDNRSLMADKVADCEWRILNGSQPEIQLKALTTDLQMSRHTSFTPYRAEVEEVEEI